MVCQCPADKYFMDFSCLVGPMVLVLLVGKVLLKFRNGITYLLLRMSYSCRQTSHNKTPINVEIFYCG
ncbi:hypothetical protein PSPTOT1_3853 [Pseudomonas syringae pv. tomato T1]|nr:hypothetical protein PSPTOT1_3853 [Pseudomonas syringae pv. tomato T1]